MKIKNAEVEIDGDDIWINGDLISRSLFRDIWILYQDNDIQNKFDTLEEAAKHCLKNADVETARGGNHD